LVLSVHEFFFVVGGDIQMEISELILSHHFFDQDVRLPEKKNSTADGKRD